MMEWKPPQIVISTIAIVLIACAVLASCRCVYRMATGKRPVLRVRHEFDPEQLDRVLKHV